MNDDSIESRLTDYLDNNLSPKERAEIEQYLANNPRQKQILAQLAETRELLKSLDHAQAPEDIFDTIQSHLERDQLLGEPLEARGRSRSKKLMQTFLVAAILALAVGLAAVIYEVIAPPGERAPEIALTTTAPSEDEAPAPVAAPADRNRSIGGVAPLSVPATQSQQQFATAEPQSPAPSIAATQSQQQVFSAQDQSPGQSPSIAVRQSQQQVFSGQDQAPAQFSGKVANTELDRAESRSQVFANPTTQAVAAKTLGGRPRYSYPALAATVPATTQATTRASTRPTTQPTTAQSQIPTAASRPLNQ